MSEGGRRSFSVSCVGRGGGVWGKRGRGREEDQPLD